MIKFRICLDYHPGIERIEIIRESSSQVFRLDWHGVEFSEAKGCRGWMYFDSFEIAKNELIRHMKFKVSLTERLLKKAKNNLKRIEDLEDSGVVT